MKMIVKCPDCGWPNRADASKSRHQRQISCRKCKQSFDPFPELPKSDKPEFPDLEKLNRE